MKSAILPLVGSTSKPLHFVLRFAIESPLDFLHVLLAERSIEKKDQRLWEIC